MRRCALSDSSTAAESKCLALNRRGETKRASRAAGLATGAIEGHVFSQEPGKVAGPRAQAPGFGLSGPQLRIFLEPGVCSLEPASDFVRGPASSV